MRAKRTHAHFPVTSSASFDASWIAESWLAGSLSSTKYKLKRTPERVTITRLHHPLAGQQLDVLMEGVEYLVVQLRDGTPMRLPRRWTDADGHTGQEPGARKGMFSAESLRELMRVLDGMPDKG